MSFNSVYPYVKQFEGGWVNDPSDSGGETFRGISRVNWPKWAGWLLIDKAKTKGNKTAKQIDAYFKGDAAMEQDVQDFYYGNFYVPCETLGLPERATGKFFDTSVNCGHSRAVKLAQEVLGVTVDGAAGPKTKAAIQAYFKSVADEGKFLNAYCGRQAAFYRAIVARKPSQAKYLAGWLKRAAWFPK